MRSMPFLRLSTACQFYRRPFRRLTLVLLGIFAHMREISVSEGSEPRNSVGSLLYNGTGLKGLSSSLLSMSYVFRAPLPSCQPSSLISVYFPQLVHEALVQSLKPTEGRPLWQG